LRPWTSDRSLLESPGQEFAGCRGRVQLPDHRLDWPLQTAGRPGA
jgi:hypothetical protein